ncbi:pectate lyase [Paraburkholderia sp. HD33-4]|uniref:pectate lyase n=1 Tax=Paraburkholderia sp. HD33-4 TaxID=2883242 RepID=UPI001F40774E|nr:pectate lyase [Paraburkholderia sp. HD33-4]
MLQITFNEPPTLGTTGKLYVYAQSGNTLVDTIDISGTPTQTTGETYATYFPEANTEIDALAAGVTTLSGDQRFVYYTPVVIAGNTATIHLHDGKLQPNTAYYVTADSTVFNDGNGNNFTGLSTPSAWTFATRAQPTVASATAATVPGNAPAGTTSMVAVTVDAAGNGDFNTVQGALDWVMQNCGTGATSSTCSASSVLKRITIDKGSYNELLYLRNVNNVTLTGSTTTPTDTVVYANNFESYNPGSGGGATAAGTSNSSEAAGGDTLTRRSLGGGRSVFLMEGSDLVTLRYFTLQNSHVKQSTFNNQAETFYFNNTKTNGGRFVASNMQLLSAQDTVLTKGWAYFYNDYIAGDVDFVWGYPYAAMFDHSELHTIYNVTSTAPTGYVVQSRAYSGYANTNTGTFITTPGFVIANSKLTADSTVPTGTAFLARSGGAGVGCAMPGASTAQGTNCDSVAYVNDQIGTHISTGGWLGSAEGATGSALNVSPTTGQTAMIGWREWGSMDGSGNALSLAGRDTTVATYTVPLTGSSAATDLTSPTAVFAGWNNGAGWTPTP